MTGRVSSSVRALISIAVLVPVQAGRLIYREQYSHQHLQSDRLLIRWPVEIEHLNPVHFVSSKMCHRKCILLQLAFFSPALHEDLHTSIVVRMHMCEKAVVIFADCVAISAASLP